MMPFVDLFTMLVYHEGLKTSPYLDTEGKLTIGVGRNLTDRGLTEDECYHLLDNDVDRCARQAQRAFSWFSPLNSTRKDVIISMVFNLGLFGFMGFKKFRNHMKNYEYDKAADEMLDSKWARQVGLRANDLSEMMRHGQYPNMPAKH